MAEGVVIVDRDGRVIECNQAAQTILGRSVDEIIGRRGSVVSRKAIKEAGTRFRVAECPVVMALRGTPCTGVVMGLKPIMRYAGSRLIHGLFLMSRARQLSQWLHRSAT
jgi:hypothetical protein